MLTHLCPLMPKLQLLLSSQSSRLQQKSRCTPTCTSSRQRSATPLPFSSSLFLTQGCLRASSTDAAIYWAKDEAREGYPPFSIVPVLTLELLLSSIPEDISIEWVKTDMQGFDLRAARSASLASLRRVKKYQAELYWCALFPSAPPPTFLPACPHANVILRATPLPHNLSTQKKTSALSKNTVEALCSIRALKILTRIGARSWRRMGFVRLVMLARRCPMEKVMASGYTRNFSKTMKWRFLNIRCRNLY